MTGYFRVSNWKQHQHYRDRNPPWIKLQKEVIDSFEWCRLQDASKAIALVIWIVASEHKDPSSGLLEDNIEKIAHRARCDVLKAGEAVKDLIRNGFLIHEKDSSDLLSPCYQNAVPETEAETEAETEGECGAALPRPRHARAIRINDWIKILQKSDDSIGMRCCPDDLGEWAQKEFKWSNNAIVQEWGSFYDYWSASNRPDSAKMDWPAAWRRWCEKTVKDQTREGFKKWA